MFEKQYPAFKPEGQNRYQLDLLGARPKSDLTHGTILHMHFDCIHTVSWEFVLEKSADVEL
jgi:hypothetical protein